MTEQHRFSNVAKSLLARAEVLKLLSDCGKAAETIPNDKRSRADLLKANEYGIYVKLPEDTTVEELNSLHEIPNLRMLEVRNENTKTALVDVLQTIPNIEHIYFNESKLTDTELQKVVQLKQLKGIYLHGTNVTDVGIKELEKLPHLESLIISGDKVTDRTMDLVANLKSLKSLNVIESSVTDAGLETLKQLPNIEHMFLRENNTSAQKVQEMQAFCEKNRKRALEPDHMVHEVANPSSDVISEVIVGLPKNTRVVGS